MSKPRRTILNSQPVRRTYRPSRPTYHHYRPSQPPPDYVTIAWISAFAVAIAIFVLASEHWGFRIAFGGFVLLCFFVYLALV